MDDEKKMLEEWVKFLFPIYEYFLGHTSPPFYYNGEDADNFYKEIKKWIKNKQSQKNKK